MKERPILFSATMVRAILEGRKTQTRRILKPQPDGWIRGSSGTFGVPKKITTKKPHKNGAIWQEPDGTCYDDIVCPYGQPDDRLWVRETWRRSDWPTGHPYEYRATAKEDGTPEDGPWKPSLFMPREASRVLLEITEVRVERLLAHQESDAIAEGVYWSDRYAGYVTDEEGRNFHASSPQLSYLNLWASINGDKSIDENPWVWVIALKKVEQ